MAIRSEIQEQGGPTPLQVTKWQVYMELLGTLFLVDTLYTAYILNACKNRKQKISK